MKKTKKKPSDKKPKQMINKPLDKSKARKPKGK